MESKQSIRRWEERAARKDYKCQCGQADCDLTIKPKETYIRIFLVTKTNDGYQNSEKSVSKSCKFWERWKQFLQG